MILNGPDDVPGVLEVSLALEQGILTGESYMLLQLARKEEDDASV